MSQIFVLKTLLGELRGTYIHFYEAIISILPIRRIIPKEQAPLEATPLFNQLAATSSVV